MLINIILIMNYRYLTASKLFIVKYVLYALYDFFIIHCSFYIL